MICAQSIYITNDYSCCLKTLKNCYNNDFDHFTDEASLLESNGHNIRVINSVNKNIKITEKKDLELVKQLLSNE